MSFALSLEAKAKPTKKKIMAKIIRENKQENKPSVPMNASAEKAAISIILQNHAALDLAKWDPDLFFDPTYKELLSVAKESHHLGNAADMFKLQSLLEEKGTFGSVGGAYGFTEIFTAYPAPDAVMALEFRKDLMRARKYRKALAKLSESNQDIREMRADLVGIGQSLSSEDEEPEVKTSLAQQCLALVTELERETPPERLKTGIDGLDDLLNGGFERGTVAVFASETSGGKSIALLQTALCGACDAKKGVIFSLEMSATQVLARMVGNISGVKCVSAFENPNKAQMAGISAGITKLSKLPIIIEDKISSIDEIEAFCRREAKNGLDWVVVDYIQLCSASAESQSETREQQVSEVVRKLKLLALRYNLWILTASQVNDKGELRESRAIGHHPDYVLVIDHSDHPDSLIRIVKNRNGVRYVNADVQMQGEISKFIDR
jgi:replicative DNA helicase